MPGITILDSSPQTRRLSFDLIDVLLVLGEDARRSSWSVRAIEALGERAAALHDADDQRRALSGDELLEIARGVQQVIDGELSARLPGTDAPWIVIRAVDSSAYDVETARADVLDALRARFGQVENLPE